MTSSLALPLPLLKACSCLGFALLVLTLGSEEARALERTPEEKAAARALVIEADVAFEAGDFQRAHDLFDRAAELVDVPTIALMQARSLVELGRLVAAAERYAAAQRIDPADSDNVAFRSAAKLAAGELETLKKRIPTLHIKLAGAGSTGARVVLDGRPLAPAAAAEDQLLDPGRHNVEIRTAAGTSVNRAVTLAEGAREQLVFNFESTVRVPTSVMEPVPASRPHDAGGKPRVAGWVTLGSGVAFTGAGAVLGALALNHKTDLDSACVGGCPAEYADDLSAYRVERTLSYVGFALGAAGVGAGLYLLLRSEPDATTTALALSPSGVSLSGRFQ